MTPWRESNPMRQVLARWIATGLDYADSLDWLAPLLMRIYFGYFWAETGWDKIHNLDAFAQRFVGWGIPYPHISAALSGYAEWVGGILLMLGLFTRLVSIPLMFNMFVAIVKVKMKEVTGINDFAEMDEVLYMFILFWLMMAGPGRVSVDHLIRRALGLGHPTEGEQRHDERRKVLA
jgi:putative oxidoreductase